MDLKFINELAEIIDFSSVALGDLISLTKNGATDFVKEKACEAMLKHVNVSSNYILDIYMSKETIFSVKEKCRKALQENRFKNILLLRGIDSEKI